MQNFYEQRRIFFREAAPLPQEPTKNEVIQVAQSNLHYLKTSIEQSQIAKPENIPAGTKVAVDIPYNYARGVWPSIRYTTDRGQQECTLLPDERTTGAHTSMGVLMFEQNKLVVATKPNYQGTISYKDQHGRERVLVVGPKVETVAVADTDARTNVDASADIKQEQVVPKIQLEPLATLKAEQIRGWALAKDVRTMVKAIVASIDKTQKPEYFAAWEQYARDCEASIQKVNTIPVYAPDAIAQWFKFTYLMHSYKTQLQAQYDAIPTPTKPESVAPEQPMSQQPAPVAPLVEVPQPSAPASNAPKEIITTKSVNYAGAGFFIPGRFATEAEYPKIMYKDAVAEGIATANTHAPAYLEKTKDGLILQTKPTFNGIIQIDRGDGKLYQHSIIPSPYNKQSSRTNAIKQRPSNTQRAPSARPQVRAPEVVPVQPKYSYNEMIVLLKKIPKLQTQSEGWHSSPPLQEFAELYAVYGPEFDKNQSILASITNAPVYEKFMNEIQGNTTLVSQRPVIELTCKAIDTLCKNITQQNNSVRQTLYKRAESAMLALAKSTDPVVQERYAKEYHNAFRCYVIVTDYTNRQQRTGPTNAFLDKQPYPNVQTILKDQPITIQQKVEEWHKKVAPTLDAGW